MPAEIAKGSWAVRAGVLVETRTHACVFMSLAAAASVQRGGQPGAFLNFGIGGRAMDMGGAYYAVAVWNRVLEIDLNNRSVRDLLQSIRQ